MGIIIGIFIALLIGIVSVILYLKMMSKINALKTTKYDKSELENIDNTQDLLPFKDINRNRIDLGNHHYVAFIKVEPFNYIIRSREGKEGFSMRLHRVINSIPFQFYFFTHTRKMTNEKMLSNLSTTIDETVRKHPDQKDYANSYFERMSVVNLQNPDTGALRKVKTRYIIIPWSPDENHAAMSDSELENVANEELKNRVSMVLEQFKTTGIKADYVSTEGIINLLTDIYHRNESNRSDLVYNNSYLSTLVGASDVVSLNDPEMLKNIIEGSMNQINEDIISNSHVDSATKRRGSSLYEILGKLKAQIK